MSDNCVDYSILTHCCAFIFYRKLNEWLSPGCLSIVSNISAVRISTSNIRFKVFLHFTLVLILLEFFFLFSEALSLELTKIVIPTYKFHGETALLECQYELRTNKNNRNYHSRYSNNRDYGYRSIHTSLSDDNNGFDHLHNSDGSRSNSNSNGGGGGSGNAATSDEEETLYAVKWYKDNEEFYRYIPKANPPQQSYRVEGIRVDVSIKIVFSNLFIYILYDFMYDFCSRIKNL